MSALLVADCGRAVALAFLAVALARVVAVLVAGMRGRLVVALMMAWVLVPALAIGYAWAALPVRALAGPCAHQVVHALLVGLRLAPVALAVAWAAPAAPWTAAACVIAGQMAPEQRERAGLPAPWVAWWLRGPGRRWVLAFLVVFPLAAGEFEIGSRLDVGVWAVRLFDAQAGGEELHATLLRALPVVLVQLAALVAAWVIARGRGNHVESAESIADTVGERTSVLMSRMAWVVVAAGTLALVVVPLGMVAAPLGASLAAIASMAGAIRRELAATIVFGLAGGTCAWWLAGSTQVAAASSTGRYSRSGSWWSAGVIAVAALGLCGGMPLGLAMIAMLPPSWVATPAPLVVALAVLALPFALMARRLCTGEAAALQSARMLLLGDRRQIRSGLHVLWRIGAGPRWWAWAGLTWWCAWELPASAVLHPLDMTPVLVLLYNFMHYGESAALSAQLGLALVVPLAGLALLYPLARWWSGRLARSGRA
jgi:hypothetical protein